MAIRLLIFLSALGAVGIAAFAVRRFTRSGLGQKLGDLFLTLFYLVVTIAVLSALVYPIWYFRGLKIIIITFTASLLLVVMLRRRLKISGSTDDSSRRFRTSILSASYLSLFLSGIPIALYAAAKFMMWMDD